jgi:hypothetical protein
MRVAPLKPVQILCSKFLTIGNNNVTDAQTCEVGATLAPMPKCQGEKRVWKLPALWYGQHVSNFGVLTGFCYLLKKKKKSDII